MKTQDENSAKAKTINEAGREFFEELIRHHVGCERSEASTVPHDVPDRLTPLDAEGAAFIARTLKYFYGDISYREIDPPAEAAA